MTYELIEKEPFLPIIKKTDIEGKEFWIPVDEANSDYQEYLKWKAEQEVN